MGKVEFIYQRGEFGDKLPAHLSCNELLHCRVDLCPCSSYTATGLVRVVSGCGCIMRLLSSVFQQPNKQAFKPQSILECLNLLAHMFLFCQG